MTMQQLETMEDYADQLQSLAMSADNVNFRAQVPAGTELGETQIEPGAKTVWRKAASGQRLGNQELPDRVPLYNLTTGDVSMVPPTIAMKRIMSRPGEFSMKKPEGFEPPQPIDETCTVCLARRKGVPRPFYTDYDLEAHYQILHPREWATMQRRREQDERREDRERQDRIMEMLVSRVNEDSDERPRRGRKAAE